MVFYLFCWNKSSRNFGHDDIDDTLLPQDDVVIEDQNRGPEIYVVNSHQNHTVERDEYVSQIPGKQSRIELEPVVIEERVEDTLQMEGNFETNKYSCVRKIFLCENIEMVVIKVVLQKRRENRETWIFEKRCWRNDHGGI